MEQKLIERYYSLFDEIKKKTIELAKEKCKQNYLMHQKTGYQDYVITNVGGKQIRFNNIEIRNNEKFILNDGIIYNWQILCEILSQ